MIPKKNFLQTFIHRLFIYLIDKKKILAIAGRALVGEGILIKECRKKPKSRYFFLFNDILVYGTSVISKKKYINQHVIPLNNVQIKSITDNVDNPSNFIKFGTLFLTKTKVFRPFGHFSGQRPLVFNDKYQELRIFLQNIKN